MKAYLDTTIITLLLFGQRHHPAHYAEVEALFVAIDKGQLQAVVSLYALQELCAYCYMYFSAEQAPSVVRLAFHELTGHAVLLVSLLNRSDRLILSRRFPMRDASDQAHAATAYREHCDCIITYDHHYQDIAERFPCLTAREALDRLATSSE